MDTYTARDLARDSRCSLKLAKRAMRLINRQLEKQDRDALPESRLKPDSAQISASESLGDEMPTQSD